MVQRIDARLSAFSSPMLSIFRIMFGVLFALHGTMKLFGWPLGEAAPVGAWPMWWAGVIELVTGVLITIGFFTRIAAIIAAGMMAVAYFWQHWGILGGELGSFWPFANGGNGGELAILFCFGFLLLATTGAGAWSVDQRGRASAITSR
ncbi:DoxX family protein [Mycobacterium sp. SMC-4]|uniref:DoxX family protein n=1 Tax=Mycobacterium sp. SMC-4 TaxID=2857059 RepID=UPI0021B24F2D|nr:DoxX family protein [Mycobacterium sp. SMC-4]UXA16277.1 DoxX family protein [Mycobacterium sp. SMC-4]